MCAGILIVIVVFRKYYGLGYVIMSGAHGGCGVGMRSGRLGVCGSTDVSPLRRQSIFGIVMFGNTALHYDD